MRKIFTPPINELIDLYRDGLSVREIGVKYGVSPHPIRTRLIEAGVTFRRGAWRKDHFYTNNLLGMNKHRAKRKGYEWRLSLEEFVKLIFSPCHYCGIKSSNVSKSTSKYREDLRYNGIDRKDSSRGYVPENCLPCCKYCNAAKLDRSYESFIEWVHSTSKFLMKEGSA